MDLFRITDKTLFQRIRHLPDTRNTNLLPHIFIVLAIENTCLYPRKTEFKVVYCFQPVSRYSVSRSFHQHLRFSSVTLVMFVRFLSNFHDTVTIRQCMFDGKIGTEGSVLQELCHLVIPPDILRIKTGEVQEMLRRSSEQIVW